MIWSFYRNKINIIRKIGAIITNSKKDVVLMSKKIITNEWTNKLKKEIMYFN